MNEQRHRARPPYAHTWSPVQPCDGSKFWAIGFSQSFPALLQEGRRSPLLEPGGRPRASLHSHNHPPPHLARTGARFLERLVPDCWSHWVSYGCSGVESDIKYMFLLIAVYVLVIINSHYNFFPVAITLILLYLNQRGHRSNYCHKLIGNHLIFK